MSDLPSYRFGPRQEGAALGLTRTQLIGLGSAGALSMVLVLSGHHHLLAGLAVLVLGAAFSFVPVAGRPLLAWLGPLSSHLTSPRHAFAPPVRHELRVGEGIAPRRPARVARWHLPGLGTLRIETVASPLGPIGVAALGGVRREVSFTFELMGPRFGLADPHDQVRALAAWGQLLGALAHESGRLRRLQIVERVEPDDLTLQYEFVTSACGKGDRRAVALYRAELDALAGRALRHEVYLTVALGRVPEREIARTVTSEATRLYDLLDGAGFAAEVLGPARLVAVLRSSLDPGASDIAAALVRGDIEPDNAAPTAWRATWGGVQTDSGAHACFEACGLPRLPVGPEWAWPLVLADETTARRSLALHIELARPAAAIRRAERAVVNEEGDEALRARWGFRSGARQEQALESARSREEELAEGFADAQFALFVSISTTEDQELESSCRSLTSQAARSHIELRRYYGHQAAALAATLPLGLVRFPGGWR